MPKRAPKPEDPTPPDEAMAATADWEMMGRIDLALTQALQKFLETLVRKERRGVDLTTMVMVLHNFHVMQIMGIAAQIAPTNPIGRKMFYMNVRDTFVRRMNMLIKEMEDLLISSAIEESDRKRARKEMPD